MSKQGHISHIWTVYDYICLHIFTYIFYRNDRKNARSTTSEIIVNYNTINPINEIFFFNGTETIQDNKNNTRQMPRLQVII